MKVWRHLKRYHIREVRHTVTLLQTTTLKRFATSQCDVKSVNIEGAHCDAKDKIQ